MALSSRQSDKKHGTNVLTLHPTAPFKFGFQRAHRREDKGGARRGQLNLFSGSAQVLKFPAEISLFEEALILDEQGDSRAEEVYWRAISDGDSVADAYCNLGILQSNSEAPGRAFDSFTKSLEHNARHFESHYNLGNLYFEGGDLRLARMHYEIAIGIDPGFPNLYFNLGLVLASQEELQKAIDAFRKYQSLVPADEAHKADDVLLMLERSLGLKKK